MKKLGAASALLTSLRDLRTDELRKDAEVVPNLVVLAPTKPEADEIAAGLTGLAASPYVRLASFEEQVSDLDITDSVVIFDPAKSELAAVFASAVKSANPACAVVWWQSNSAFDPKAATKSRKEILNIIPDRAISFGRHFPGFRTEAVKSVTDDVARANAKFAVIANVPSMIPLFGSFVGATADLIIITRNQALLVYKIAAIHGQDLDDHIRIYKEIAPVVGAGFFWRSLAREAVAFIPFAGGTVPKVAIAYSGTIAIGQAADYYYRTGKRPTTQQIQRYFMQGMKLLRKANVSGLSKYLGDEEVEVNYKVLEEEIA